MKENKSFDLRLLVVGIVTLAFVLGLQTAVFCEKPWYPAKMRAWYGEYDPNQKGPDGKGKLPDNAAPSLGEMKLIDWMPPKATKPWKIGIAFTHLKDPYWITINEAMITEAKRLGIEVHVLDAGGYDQLARQQEQVENLVSLGMDAIVLCSISYTGNDAVIKEVVKKGIPLVASPQDVFAAEKTAAVTPSYYVAGHIVLDWFLREVKGQKGVKVVWLPGPAGATWSEAPYYIFEQALEEKGIGKDKIEILDVKWGQSGMDVQLGLIEGALRRHPKVDYIIGCAPGAEAALRAVSEAGLVGKTKVISTYLTPPLLKPLLEGKLIFTTYDETKIFSRVAIDMAVAILEGAKPGKDIPFRLETSFTELTPESVKAGGMTYEDFFAPKDWKPVFSYKP